MLAGQQSFSTHFVRLTWNSSSLRGADSVLFGHHFLSQNASRSLCECLWAFNQSLCYSWNLLFFQADFPSRESFELQAGIQNARNLTFSNKTQYLKSHSVFLESHGDSRLIKLLLPFHPWFLRTLSLLNIISQDLLFRSCRVYRLSAKEKLEVESQVDELLAKGFIQPSNSPYGSPVLFVQN